jgi:hypothetical protein
MPFISQEWGSDASRGLKYEINYTAPGLSGPGAFGCESITLKSRLVAETPTIVRLETCLLVRQQSDIFRV